MGVYREIIDRLNRLGVAYEQIDHEIAGHCEDSLRCRAMAGWTGASSKCILLHAKGRHYLVVTTAEKELVARLFKKEFGTKDIRFAKTEDLARLTGCEPGSVSPFGHPNAEFPYYVDEGIFRAEHFMFTPSDPARSIRIRTGDLRRIYASLPNPVRYFSEDETGRLDFRGRDER